MNKVSVIIPVYNVKEYIKECLDSVINQTYANIEIICIDDCGTDNSMDIVQAYTNIDDRIKIIHHTCNKGLAPSRNSGLDNATGNYIFFLDSDDKLELTAIENLLDKILETKSDIVISKTHTYTFDKTNLQLQKRVEEVTDYLNFIPQDTYLVDEFNLDEAILKISCVAWGKLYSKRFLDEHRIRFVDKNLIHEDDGFNLKCLVSKPIISLIGNIGVHYLIRKNSITSKIENKKNRSKKIKNMQQVLEDVFDFIEKNINNPQSKINIIKNSNLYNCYFGVYHKNCFYSKIVTKNLYKFNLLGIPILRITKSNEKKSIKILGIPFIQNRRK